MRRPFTGRSRFGGSGLAMALGIGQGTCLAGGANGAGRLAVGYTLVLFRSC